MRPQSRTSAAAATALSAAARCRTRHSRFPLVGRICYWIGGLFQRVEKFILAVDKCRGKREQDDRKVYYKYAAFTLIHLHAHFPAAEKANSIKVQIMISILIVL